ncbi:HDOD domain-containing protein, partial [Desulfoplanes sp.]
MDDPQALTKKISKSLRLCQQTIFPPVMGKLLHEAMQPDPDLQKIADIIRLDPPLTAMVLALANSPYYKLSSPVSGIQRAAVVLGNKELLKIVLFVSFQNRLKSFSTSRESGLISSWNATVWAATAAEQLARHLDPAHTSQAYLCTLLKDLSRILLATTDSLPFTLKELATFSPQQAAVEKRMWGTTHAHLTKELLDQWSLPDICTEGILAHHDVDHLDQHPPLVQAVILATRWAEVEFQHKGDPRPALQFTLLAQKILGIDEDGFEILRTQVTETFRSMCDILEIPQVKIWERFFDHSIKTMQHLFFLSIDIRNIPHGIPSVAKSIGMHLNLYWGIDNWDMALI